jgi:hypothetical protein
VVNSVVRANSIPASSGKLLAQFGNNDVSYAPFADYVCETHGCQLRCVDMLPAQEVDCHLPQSIDDDPDAGIPRGG